MPPKKAAGKKNKKGASASSGYNGLDLCTEDHINHLQCQIAALQSELTVRSEAAAKAATQRDEIKQQMAETTNLHKQEKEVSEAVIRDATRHYKAMKEQLLDKLNVRDNTIQDLRDELERKQKYHDDMVEEKDGIILEKDEEIRAAHEKMEGLCSQFADMLGAALGNVTDFLDRKVLEYNSSEDMEQQLQAMYGGGTCNDNSV